MDMEFDIARFDLEFDRPLVEFDWPLVGLEFDLDWSVLVFDSLTGCILCSLT